MFFQYTLIILLQFILDFRRDALEEFFEDRKISAARPLCLLTKEGNISFWNPTKDCTGHWTPLQHSDGISTKIRTQFGMLFHISVELRYANCAMLALD